MRYGVCLKAGSEELTLVRLKRHARALFRQDGHLLCKLHISNTGPQLR